jgi:hypothetical protein
MHVQKRMRESKECRGRESAHLGVGSGGIIKIEMELLRPPGPDAAAAPTAAALYREPRRSALSAANRAVSGAAAGSSCAGGARRAASSSLELQCALCSDMRACSLPGCRGLGPAIGVVLTPTLPG